MNNPKRVQSVGVELAELVFGFSAVLLFAKSVPPLSDVPTYGSIILGTTNVLGLGQYRS